MMATTGSNRWIVIFTVMLGSLLQLIDTSIVNVSLIQMMGNLGATLGDISWVVTGYAASNVVMITLSGWLSAKFGRKNYFAASIVLFTVASIFCGTSTGVWELVLFRVIQGIGGGGLLSTAQAIMLESFPKEQAGTANAIFGMGVIIGPTIGPALGGYITDNYSWQWIFYINVPLGILAAILTLMFIQDPPFKQHAGRMDWLGIALLIVGIGSLQVVLEKGESEDWFQTQYITLLTLFAAIGFVGFIAKMLMTKDPIIDLRIMRHRSFAVGSLFNFILGFGLFASVFVIPVFAQNILGFTASETGLLLMPGSIATAFAMPIVGKAITKLPAQLLSGIGFLIFFLFALKLSHLNLSVGADDFFWPLIIRGVGLGLIFIPLTTLALSDLNGPEIPQGTALSNMLRQLGGSFGTAIMTTYISTRTKTHYGQLMTHVVENDPMSVSRLNSYQSLFLSKGYAAVEASKQALTMLYSGVVRQSALLTYCDAFLIVGGFFLICIPLLFLFKFKRNAGGGHVEMIME